MEEKMVASVELLFIEDLGRSSSAPYKIKVRNNSEYGLLACFNEDLDGFKMNNMYEVLDAQYNEDYKQWLIKGKGSIVALNHDFSKKTDVVEDKTSTHQMQVDGKEVTAIEIANTVKPLSTSELQIFTMEQWEHFNWLKNQLVDKDDWHSIGGKAFLKKSGFRKLAGGFQLSLEEKSVTLERFDPPLPVTSKSKTNPKTHLVDWQYIAKVRVSSPDGRVFADGSGVCANFDKGVPWDSHDAHGKALTRAFNRAIADLVGYGLTSSDDMN